MLEPQQQQQQQQQQPQQKQQSHVARASRTTILLNTAEIATATKVSRKTAQASPVLHYRSSSSSSSMSKEGQDAAYATHTAPAAAQASSRIMPSQLPPPSAALPPTPRPTPAATTTSSTTTSPTLNGHRLSYRNSNGSAYAAPSILNRSIRKTFRHLSVGLTHEEHSELVQKILTDLKPAHISTTVRPFSRASRPVSVASSHHKMSANKAQPNASDEKRHSASWQSDEARSSASHGSRSGDDKLSTPQLSQSRTPTPTTPSSPMTRENTDEKQTSALKASSDATMSPATALENLRVLENSFDQSATNSPLNACFNTEDTKISQNTTAVASSPTNAASDEKQVSARPAPVKRNSSYRKSVPTLDELASKKGLGISSSTPPSPSCTTPKEATGWISSLTTLEAVRVLAFQQDVADACASPTVSTPPPSEDAIDAATSPDEVNALRFALKFALARADKLAEELNRANEDKIKTETELEILRSNVLSMLGSKNMFGTPRHGNRCMDDDELAEEDEQFHDARSRQTRVSVEQQPVKPVVASRPPRAVRGGARSVASTAAATKAKPAAVAAAAVAAAAPAKPSGGVSIASLRKNTSAAPATASSTAQRYTPSRTDAAPASDSEEEDDSDFDMYPFAAPRRAAAAEVSMTDFLNASRMSKTEIADHDARRELDQQATLDEPDDFSVSSHAPLKGFARRSLNGSANGFFKGFSSKFNVVVDSDRKRHNSRRSSIMKISSPVIPTAINRSNSPLASARKHHHHQQQQQQQQMMMSYREESIIPTYPTASSTTSPTKSFDSHPHRRGAAAGGGGYGTISSSMSLASSLRESLEKHSLREAGIRT